MALSLTDPWKELLGEATLHAVRTDVRHPFDANASGIAVDLGAYTVFFFEDPNDGYRSSCASPMIAQGSMHEYGVSPEYVRAPVLIQPHTKNDGGFPAEGLEFVDRRNAKTILIVGTDNTGDYYPWFVCDWRPQNLATNE